MNKEAIKNEIKEVFSISLFFFILFLLFVLLKKAFLVQYNISYSGFGTAIFGALVLGKVVLLIDKLKFARIMDQRPQYQRVLYRSVFYLVGYILFTFLEHGIISFFTEDSFGEAMLHNFHDLTSFTGLARLLILFVSFVIFNGFWVIRKHIGVKELSKLFFHKPPSK